MKFWNGAASAFSESGKGTYDWMKKPFLWLCFWYTVALLAIFRANYYYVDDLGRAMMGYHGWLDWSRYVTQWLSFVIHPTPHLTDISPLPQLLAVVLMSLAGLLVIYTFTGKKEISWPLLVGVLPMGLSPWFLECFSYKFDAPYMALSVLVSILPFVWWHRDRKKFFLVSFACLLAMTMTYQAASGIFVIEALFLSFQDWNRGGRAKEIFRQMLVAAVVYVTALLLYKIFLFRPPLEEYVLTDVADSSLLPEIFLSNMMTYLQLAWTDLSLAERLWAAAMVLLFVMHAPRAGQRNRIAALLLGLVLLAVTLVLSYGSYLVLEKPLTAPRAMYGMGLWFSFVLISLLAMTPKKGPARWMALLMVWQLMAGAAAYGNALYEQQRYTDFRVQLLAQDLNTLGLTGDDRIQYHLLGTTGHAPVVRNVETDYPVVKRLVEPNVFSDKDTWTRFYFYFYHDLGIHIRDRGNTWIYKPEMYSDLPVVLENQYHRIRANGDDVLIELKTSSYGVMERDAR